SDGFQELDILVKGRYMPDVVRVIRGIPVRLRFKREEDTQCSEQVIFSEFCGGVRLPAYRTTLVRFTPTRCGEFFFTCALGMYHGRLLVVPPSRRDLARIGGNR
ncbi:MAG: cupredoxin domain-containing protein, partial [Chloroflexi bacterium]|nr:cupredoxin domain-containing protein [Chloroflexota bacterium]